MGLTPRYLPGGLFPSHPEMLLSDTGTLAELGKALASPWTPGRKCFKDSSSPELRETHPPHLLPNQGGGKDQQAKTLLSSSKGSEWYFSGCWQEEKGAPEEKPGFAPTGT